MTARWLAVAVACAACGDNLQRAGDPFTAVSGTRLALQKYRYEDGTELAVAGEFYDTQLHTRCAPRPWSDGAVRCVPVADDAEYIDAACTMRIGLGRTVAKPTHFVAGDTLAGGGIATRVFRAGAAAAAITQYYSIAGGACIGPTAVPQGLTSFFAIGDEVDGTDLVALGSDEVGDDRLALQIRQSDDGMRVASGLRDRELDAVCTATVQGDGRALCEPIAAATAIYFGDPTCSEPAMAVGSATVPAIARLIEPSGCASYHRIGRELAPPVYRRDGGACTPVSVPTGDRLFSIDAPIELPALGRSLEEVRGRRLQRIVLDHGALHLFDDRVFDTATGLDCRPRALRDAIRCLPANLAAGTTLFTDGCTAQVRVAEVPQHACQRIAHATTNRPFQVREIGDIVATPLFQFDGTTCRPYTPAAGNELRQLGPPLDLAMFMSAIYFGER